MMTVAPVTEFSLFWATIPRPSSKPFFFALAHATPATAQPYKKMTAVLSSYSSAEVSVYTEVIGAVGAGLDAYDARHRGGEFDPSARATSLPSRGGSCASIGRRT